MTNGGRASLAAMAMMAAMLTLPGCAATLVPRPDTPSTAARPPAGTRPATRPQVPEQSTTRQPAARQPVAATPIAPAIAPAVDASITTAAAATLTPGPAIDSLPISESVAARALAAFRISCPSLIRRTDASGLTRGADWQPACSAAAGASDARRFFAERFETVQVADGKAFATGYYEPEIAGSRRQEGPYQTPVYARPTDLVDVALGDFSDDLKGKTIRGRVQGTSLVPYHDRTAIEEGALAGRGLEIGWAADPIELFFLQIQGSGRLRLPDGGVLRIGYAGQNGRTYTGIGALMRDRGLLAPGQASMQGIMQWLREHPEEGRALMRENKSYVFFRELTGPGPLGALGLPVTGQASVAADPKFVPLGAPVFLSMDRTDATGLWVAQDTGGAIRGPNRFDTFWGAGDDARAIAGGMSARGTAFILVPRGTIARVRGGNAAP
ncbi:murein transglycosylase A [Sphingomonas sp. BGYR3]|uniref:murein transglycosylase A n=1 Tax=Sphingomonas sp. BGYR3 TaxID=2975483 RepID=UPI0021A73289|nr:murein transglycosylase A [Sphingomonas sp. BGYR3]MDG5489202.1 murein transglycosylase A [Sphingomonas sp. BGYR3]